MRHQVLGRHLGRTSSHRKALRRNLAASLFEHGTISTTIEKAKFVRPFAEKLITLAKNGSLHARRRAIAILQDRDVCKVEDGVPAKVTTVIKRLFDEIGPRFADRPGGYTRIIRLPLRRIGDNSRLAILQLVGEMGADESVTSDKPAHEQIAVDAAPSVTDQTDEIPATTTTTDDDEFETETQNSAESTSTDTDQPSGQEKTEEQTVEDKTDDIPTPEKLDQKEK